MDDVTLIARLVELGPVVLFFFLYWRERQRTAEAQAAHLRDLQHIAGLPIDPPLEASEPQP